MTAMTEPQEAVEAPIKSLRAAHVFFLAHLANIVGDMSGLAEGTDEFDYFIPVPLPDLHVLGQRIADLEYTVKERFGIAVVALPIPVSRSGEP